MAHSRMPSVFALSASLVIYLPLFYVVYFFIKALYRLTLHPLARFPGPKLAAATRWYEVYWEVGQGGRFSQHIDSLHRQYGPIVRVNPNELHIDDPHFYDQLYNYSPDIARPWTTMSNLQSSQTFDLHRRRRRAFDPYFSRSAVHHLEPMITSNVEDLCQHFYNARDSKQPLNVTLFSRCFTAEIISDYLSAQPYGFLTHPERSEPLFAANDTIFQNLYMFRESRIMDIFFKILHEIPPSWLPDGHVGHVLSHFVKTIRQRLKLALSRSGKDASSDGHRVLFEDYPSLDLPAQDSRPQAMLDTALLLFGAGFETTAFTMEQALYHVLASPPIYARLQEELILASPNSLNMPAWNDLEKLPYLTAVISESLRFSIGVMSRLPRKNMKTDLVYKDWVIPKATLVSMSQKGIHFNKDIYPDPQKFDPERWLKGEESKQLQKYLVPFSRGARRCLGMNLAYAELYLSLSTIFRRFQLELYQTRREDVDAVLDFFVPKPEGTNGVRVLVK